MNSRKCCAGVRVTVTIALDKIRIKFCDMFIWYVDQFEPFLVSECAEVDAAF